jgi:hypothetical protein
LRAVPLLAFPARSASSATLNTRRAKLFMYSSLLGIPRASIFGFS